MIFVMKIYGISNKLIHGVIYFLPSPVIGTHAFEQVLCTRVYHNFCEIAAQLYCAVTA